MRYIPMIAAVVLAVAAPAAAQAQSANTDTAYPATQNDDEFPWGLLGLLGLAGLAGLKRRDNHVDSTRR